MKLCSIASGSSGNCIFAGTDTTSLLIDTGISGKRVEQGLNEIGHTAKDADGILITHEHSDHISGLGVIARRYGIPIYTTRGTWEAILKCKTTGQIPEMPKTFFSPSTASSKSNSPRASTKMRPWDL